ncbi:MAG: CDP-diacylglycerol--glycerol-3-phosphate 3-phosphatidyltransferase [Proteobacteria bacterium]|nr:CDP-diacylglycerol--glycerol-3-phosphate 3-phosphatidyltransferase [Pseudomonadota bacterium]
MKTGSGPISERRGDTTPGPKEQRGETPGPGSSLDESAGHSIGRSQIPAERGGRTGKAPFRPLGQEITDLPNIVTLLRIGLIPPVLISIDNYDPRLSALSCILFVIAAISDALDGYLARRMGLVTVVGKFLDPLADKLIVLSTLVVLAAAQRAPVWLVVVLMARELAVTGLRAIASQQGLVIAAGRGGKIKTALQLVGIAFLLIHFRYPIIGFDYELDFHVVGTYLLYLSLVMSLASALEYFKFFTEAAARQAAELEQQGITRAKIKERARLRKVKLRELKKARRHRLRAERRARRRARRAPASSIEASSIGGARERESGGAAGPAAGEAMDREPGRDADPGADRDR